MIEIKGLDFEQNKKFQAAIAAGYFDTYEENPWKWKHTLVGSFLYDNPDSKATLDRLSLILGHVPTWDDIDDDLLKDFVDECHEEGLMTSSIRTYCAQLKSVLNKNLRKIKAENFEKTLSVKGETSQAVYLTREEMKRIVKFQAVGEIERYVRRNFVVSMLTGARHVDAELMTINNCDADTGTLSYVPKKTPGIIVNVPIDERLSLRKFLADTYRRDCCLSVFNDTIRNICKLCDIDTESTIKYRGKLVTAPKWKFVSSHTARRSFATNLYLSYVSIEDIALMMGHGKNIETTKRYICAEREMSTNVMSYFQAK